jgi:DNA-binding MarR family transcriptional regulator
MYQRYRLKYLVFLRYLPHERDYFKEIANSLGISITTVSKALKNYPDVSDKTKKLSLLY